MHTRLVMWTDLFFAQRNLRVSVSNYFIICSNFDLKSTKITVIMFVNLILSDSEKFGGGYR